MPIREFTKSYVDAMAVHSSEWQSHLDHINRYLSTIQVSGLTLGFKKCEFAKPEVKFFGHLIGPGHRRVNPEKVNIINDLRAGNKKAVTQKYCYIFVFSRLYSKLCFRS